MIPLIQTHNGPQQQNNVRAMQDVYNIITNMGDAVKVGNMQLYNNLLHGVSQYGIDISQLYNRPPQEVVMILTDMYNEAANNINSSSYSNNPSTYYSTTNPYTAANTNRYSSVSNPYIHTNTSNSNAGIPNNIVNRFTTQQEATTEQAVSNLMGNRYNGMSTNKSYPQQKQEVTAPAPVEVKEPPKPTTLSNIKATVFCKGIAYDKTADSKTGIVGTEDIIYNGLPDVEDCCDVEASSSVNLLTAIDNTKQHKASGYVYTHTDIVLVPSQSVLLDKVKMVELLDQIKDAKYQEDTEGFIKCLTLSLSPKYISIISNFLTRRLEVDISDIDNELEIKIGSILDNYGNILKEYINRQAPKEICHIRCLGKAAFDIFCKDIEIYYENDCLYIKFKHKALYIATDIVIEDILDINKHIGLLMYTHPWLHNVIQKHSLNLLTYIDNCGIERSMYINNGTNPNNTGIKYILNVR